MSSVVRFRFRPEINAEAQQVLARLFAQFAQSMDGVTACSVQFERASGEWVAQMGGTGTPLRIGERPAASVVQLGKTWQREERA